MDIGTLKRDATKVHACLQNTEKGIIAVKPVKIYIPHHYMGTELADISEVIKFVAIYGMVTDDGFYAPSLACANFESAPSRMNIITIGKSKFIEFSYDAGDMVMVSRFLVRIQTLVFRIFEDFIDKGRVPWYLNYDDLGNLFSTAELHGGANLKAVRSLLELLAVIISRDPDDRTKFYRQSKTLSDNEVPLRRPLYIPLSNPTFGATNTATRIIGNYLNDGITGALNHKSKRHEVIEDILRGDLPVNN
jgi:hypothetical protein